MLAALGKSDCGTEGKNRGKKEKSAEGETWTPTDAKARSHGGGKRAWFNGKNDKIGR